MSFVDLEKRLKKIETLYILNFYISLKEILNLTKNPQPPASGYPIKSRSNGIKGNFEGYYWRAIENQRDAFVKIVNHFTGENFDRDNHKEKKIVNNKRDFKENINLKHNNFQKEGIFNYLKRLYSKFKSFCSRWKFWI